MKASRAIREFLIGFLEIFFVAVLPLVKLVFAIFDWAQHSVWDRGVVRIRRFPSPEPEPEPHPPKAVTREVVALTDDEREALRRARSRGEQCGLCFLAGLVLAWFVYSIHAGFEHKR